MPDRDDTHATGGAAPGSPSAPEGVDLGTTAPAPTEGAVDPKASTGDVAPAIRVASVSGREATAFAAAGYTLQGILGRGGMGVVHKAWDARLRRDVAIKVTHEGINLGAVQLERFKREAIAAARLQHPGIVGVHGSGEVEGRPYLVLELVVGQSLAEVLKAGPLPPRELAAIVRDVALALDHAHEHGIVHRDVKPENVLLDAERRPRLADFGLARDPAATEQLTSTGDVMGTPAYMAPEQVRGDSRAQGPCTDVYGLGGILYRALGGRVPFQAASAPAVLQKILHEEPAPLRSLNPAVHVDLETITLRCLQKEPERRYASAAAVAADLGRYLAGEPILARPVSSPERAWMWLRRNARLVGVVAIAIGLAAALTAGGLHLARQSTQQDEARRRAAELAAGLTRARSEVLIEGSAEHRSVVDALSSDAGPDGVASLCGALDALTERLRAVQRDVLLAAQDPTPAELERGEGRLEGLPAALERHLSRDPGTPPDAATLGVLEAARRRVEARPAERRPVATVGRSAPSALIVAGAQERALGQLGAQEARLVCEALGRAGDRAAVLPLGRYLEAEEGETRARVAAEALCAIGGPDARRIVQVRARAFGPGPFQEGVSRLLPGVAGDEGVEALLQEGVARLAAEDYPAAIAALTSAILLEPGNAEAWSQRALARRDQGAYAQAIEDARRALALDPLSLRAHMACAGAYVALRDPESAIAAVESAVALAPQSPQALTLRGEVRLAAKDPTRAQADFEAALALDARSAKAWFGLGACRQALGDDEGALAGYTHAIQLDPRSWRAWLDLGTVQADRGEMTAGLDSLTRAIDLRPSSEEAWSNRGALRRNLGDLDGAVADLKQAVALDPVDPIARQNLGLSLLDRGDVEASMVELEEAVRLGPARADAWKARATARRAMGDVVGALADLDRAVTLAPRDPTAWFNRGNAHRVHRDLADAEADYSKAIELSPRNSRAVYTRARLREERGDLRGALADHDRALTLEPGFVDGWADRGGVKARLDDLDGALVDFTKAIELDPAQGWVWGNRGQLHQLRLEFSAAVADFTKTVELVPKAYDAWRRRGECRVQLGDEAGAVGDLARFLELAPPNHPARRDASRELERLRAAHPPTPATTPGP